MTQLNAILVIDEEPIDTALIDYFTKFGFNLIQKPSPHRLLLDEPLPVALLINWSSIQNNHETINTLFHQYPIPIILFNDTANEEICVQMLEAGADDFMITPILPRELHARINAISRRVKHVTPLAEQKTEVLLFGNCRLYPSARQCFKNNTELSLSNREYDLLLAFVRHPQQTLSRKFLLQIINSGNAHHFTRQLDVHISRLRQKIETDTKQPTLIKTIRHTGYLFATHVISVKE
ncbi:winged helix-turn-helix domain-containing protein [Legionella nagasakiensis]|uniref:winged helix-turn-helix domain-containing protein n=1 Tax=Legionella nagasakiensis TaxID=535290 RepID=UPI001056CB71|nr:response regulator transcription factor [Legionella nagasakiensis]